MKNALAAARAAILDALEAIPDPATGAGLVGAGRIAGLEIRGDGGVSMTIEAPADQIEAYAAVRDAVEAAARAQKGVNDVRVALTAHRGAVRLRKGERPPAASAPPPPPRRAEGVKGVEALIAIASAKGGVGKSTVAVNLAAAFAALGRRTGLLDADVYGPSAPTLLGLADAKPTIGADGLLAPIEAFGLKTMSIGYLVEVDAPLIWRGPMATNALRQMLDDVAWAPLDVLVLDLPPGTGDIALSLVQRLPLSGAVIVSTPQELALADVRRGLAMFERVHAPILGVIENMAWFDAPGGARLHPFGEGGARRTAEAFGARFLGEIPLDPELRESGDLGRPLVAERPDHPTALRFRAIAEAALAGLADAAKPPPLIRFD